MERQSLSKAPEKSSQSSQLLKGRLEAPVAQHPLMALQQSIGARAVQRLINSHYIQAKLHVGPANDQYEQEADRVADTVMRMPDPQATPGVAVSNRAPISSVHRKCSACEEEEMQRKPLEQEEEPLEKKEVLQGKAEGDELEVSAGLETQIQSLRGGGQPLPESVRARFEPRFGQDFGGVRVHTGAQAAQVARSVNARAFTVGKDVAFGAGQYSPDTDSGQRLLAHELTHVIQQTGAAPASNQGTQNPSVQRTPDLRIMREGFESTVQVCHRVLESRKFNVTKGGVRVVLILKNQDERVPNCRDFEFGVTLNLSVDWWPDNEIGTCMAQTGATRSFSFGNLSSGTYYLTIWRIFDHPYCCLEGDILVFDEPVAGDSSGCTRDTDPSVMDIIHGALDIAGFIPALGAIPDGINAVIYAVEGDWTNAGISAVAMVPVFGDGAKLAAKGGKELIEVSGKTVIKMGKEELGAGLKQVAKEKAGKEAVEQGAKAEREVVEGATRAEREAAERAEREAVERADKEAAERAEKEAAEKKQKDKKKKTCATEYPGEIDCSRLPAGYIYPSARAALEVLKATTGKKNLRLHNPSPTITGPCPGRGTHYNVRDGNQRVASIVCCPCCKDTPVGPVRLTLCKIVY